jgi:hypothetical protein
MSYKITKIIKPKGVDFILFNNKDESAGIVNFNEMKLNNIFGLNEKVSNDESIEINFPIFDHYFAMEYKSKNGWTLKKLIATIHKTGVLAGRYLAQYRPQVFTETEPVPADFVNKYCMVSNSKKSDIMKKNNVIYVNTALIVKEN